MRRTLIAVLAACAATAALLPAVADATKAAAAPMPAPASTAAEQTAATLPTPTPINWGTCTSTSLQNAHAQCGYLTVPLDYAHPKKATVKLAVDRIVHTSADYQGVMVINPGGPGGSGVNFVTVANRVPNGGGTGYDWIGFDPRGVGASLPQLSCDPHYYDGPRPAYVPSSSDISKAWMVKAKAYDKACASYGSLLDHMTTADTAKDIDYLRTALGQGKISYYGFSYGTYLGQVYATLFPDRLDKMLLDSTVDPRTVWNQDNLDQDVAFERTTNKFFAWVAEYDSIYHLGRTTAQVKRVWYAQLDALTTSPAGGEVGGAEWTDLFLSAGYYQSTWLSLGSLFSAWVNKHDVAALTAAYSGGSDNGGAVYLATECTDAAWPSYHDFIAENEQLYPRATFQTWGNADYNLACIWWPGKVSTPVTISPRADQSVLMVDETLDAATPYSGSLYVRGLFKNARLIAEPGGTTHGDTLTGDACVDDRIAAYLGDGSLPARAREKGPDALCAPKPVPVPTATSASDTAGAATTLRAVPTAHPGAGMAPAAALPAR